MTFPLQGPASPVPAPAPGETPRRHIRALTGVRGIAALWVVSFHFRPELVDAFPQLGVFAPIMDVGHLGVDLFFILSGFILTYTHLDTMTSGRFTWRKPLAFLWLRLSRVWPLTAFCLVLWAIYLGVRAEAFRDAGAAAGLDPQRFLVHVLMLQAWTNHHHDWNPVDWSVSAEWLAYLVYSLGIFIVARLAAHSSRRARVVLALVCLVPIIMIGVSLQDGTDLLWNGNDLIPGIMPLRVLSEFAAGALATTIVKPLLARGARLRLPIPLVTAIVLVGVLYVLSYADPRPAPRLGQPWYIHGANMWGPSESAIVIPLFLVLIASLAVCRDPLERLLSTPVLVWLGKVSFAVYLIHWMMLDALRWLNGRYWHLGSGTAAVWPYRALILLAIALAIVAGWLLWRTVEEPARKVMRSMSLRGVKV